MPVPAVADVETLLAPIPGDNPAGENLLYEGTYDRIKTARRADDVLVQGDWQRELKVSDWPKVIQLATEALTTKTKDLQIAAWLTEALVKNDRLDRLAGLRDGLQLLSGLLAGFQEQLFPPIDPEDDEGPLNARANVIADLEGRLAIALTEIPVTRAAGVNYNFAQWEESRQFDVPDNFEALPYDEQTRVGELKARAAAEKKLTSEDWRKVYRATPRAFYEERLELAGECRAALKAFDQLIDECFGREAPGLRSLDQALDNLHTMLERMVKDKRIAEPWPEDEQPVTAEAALPAAEADSAGGSPALARNVTGPVRNRQEALQRLAEVAAYFRQTEPHSPVSYLVQRAVRWGEMPLENWLGEVIKDSSVLEQLREMLGIRSESE